MPRSAHTSAMVSLSRSREPLIVSTSGTTVPLNRSVALVVQAGPPNRPAQPLVHGESPSGWDRAAAGSSPGTHHSVRWGCRPADGLCEQRAPGCPGHSGSRCQALATGDGEYVADETPQVRNWRQFRAETAIWRLPVLLGIQPGTFGGTCSALLSTVRATPPESKHRRMVSRLPAACAGDRRSP